MRKLNALALLVLLFLSSCSLHYLAHPAPLEFTVLQLNDVYEIAPLEGGKAGGLARVATVRKELLAENPNLITVLAGDFLSPSFVGTLRFENETGESEKIAGLQMVETLNAMGLDYATFGNHEFDLSDPDLLEKRLAQSDFKYTVCNARRITSSGKVPFKQGADEVPDYLIHEFDYPDGRKLRLGILGVVLPFAQQDYLHYDDVIETFKATYESMQLEANLTFGLTHLNLDQDMALAAAVPDLPLFLGGHEHAALTRYVNNTIIAKADANAKTVYVHRVRFDPATKLIRIRSNLRLIDDRIAEDPATKAVVDKWQAKAFGVMTEMGYTPDRQVLTLSEPLICKESAIRTSQTNYGRLTMDAIASALPDADLYVLNSGSMRLDDNLSNIVTEYDVLRTYPFGGALTVIEVPGSTVKRALETGIKLNYGEGGYFQYKNVAVTDEGYLVNDEPIDEAKTYRIAMPSFLAQGKEARLEFLGEYFKANEVPATLSIGEATFRNDLRDVVVQYMLKLGTF